MITPLHELAAPRIAERNHIAWGWLATNPHPNAIQMLRAHIDELVNAGDTHLARSLLSNMADNSNEEVAGIFDDIVRRANGTDPRARDWDIIEWQTIRSCTRQPWMVNFLARHPDRIAGWAPYIEPDPYRQFDINGGGFSWAMVVQSETAAAIQLVENHFDVAMAPSIYYAPRQIWNSLCRNRHPAAMRLVDQHLDQMDPESWASLATNPSATHIIEGYLALDPDYNNIWNNIWGNPDIFPPEHSENPILK